MRRAVRRQGTHQVPAAAPKWRPASPARLRAQRSQPPRRRPLLRPTRRSVRGQGTHQVPAPAPQWRPASPAHLRAQRTIRRGAARYSGRRAARSAVRGHAKCPLRRRSGDREPCTPARAEKPSAEAPPAAPADAPLGPRSGDTPSARLRRRSGERRARPTSAGMGAIRQGAGSELRRRSSGGRARSSAADAGAIQQCSAGADFGAEVAACAPDGAPPDRAPSNRATGANFGAEVAACAPDGTSPARAPSKDAAGPD